MKTIRNLSIAIGALALVAFAMLAPPKPAIAAASGQTTHSWMCIPRANAGAGNRRIVVPSTAGTAYNLNGEGCTLVAAADIGYFLSQGAVNGPNIFTLQQTGITATTTSSTSTIVLPAYAYIVGIILSETAGNAITGGVDLGDTTNAISWASAIALGANATVTLLDTAYTRINVPAGVPTADQIFVKCHTSCNSGSINITILYSYF